MQRLDIVPNNSTALLELRISFHKSNLKNMFDKNFTQKLRIIMMYVNDLRTPEYDKYASSTCQAEMRPSHFVSS